VDLAGRKRSRIGREHLCVVGREIAEIAADRDDPAVLALEQNHAVAPVWFGAGDHHRDLAAEIGRPPAIEPCGVAEADLDPLFRRPRVTEAVEPGRAL
jgi:hypothetical protein